MNYLKRQSAIYKAIREAYKDRTKEERKDEFDRFSDCLHGMVDCNRGVISAAIQGIVYGTAPDMDAREARRLAMLEYMNKINGICAEYGVSPMFPNAGRDASYKEVFAAYDEYMKQVDVRFYMTKPYLDKAIKSEDFTEYDKKDEEIVEHIEEYVKEWDEEQGRNKKD